MYAPDAYITLLVCFGCESICETITMVEGIDMSSLSKISLVLMLCSVFQ